MLYVYRRKPSGGAKELAQALTDLGVRARKVRAFNRLRLRRATGVVNWGDDAPPDLPHQLNSAPVVNKLHELGVLTNAGVPTVTWSRTRVDGYLPRRSDHVGGADLLAPGRADYWVQREEISREYRLHIFKTGGEHVSIRAGRKQPYREDAHPWIRSHDAGWRLNYDGRGVTDKHRAVAKAATAALGLDFGAVDVAERPDGTVFVLEVNRAPGLEGNTIQTYAHYIKQWYEEG